MRLKDDRLAGSDDERGATMDWESMGRQVRCDALYAVAAHFAELASGDVRSVRSAASDVQIDRDVRAGAG